MSWCPRGPAGVGHWRDVEGTRGEGAGAVPMVLAPPRSPFPWLCAGRVGGGDAISLGEASEPASAELQECSN